MATIRERKSKDGQVKYQVLVRKKGARAQIVTFTRKSDAQRWARRDHVYPQGRG